MHYTQLRPVHNRWSYAISNVKENLWFILLSSLGILFILYGAAFAVVTFTPLVPSFISPKQTSAPDLADGIRQWPTVDNASAPIAQELCPGYYSENVVRTTNGITAWLRIAGQPCNIYGKDYNDLILNVTYQTDNRLNVRITDSEDIQYVIPDDVAKAPVAETNTAQKYEFEYNTQPFEFWVTRRSDGDILFDTRGTKLIFEDQYLEVMTKMEPNYNLYGLGEVIHELRLGNNLTRAMWATDLSNPIDSNMYGSHPVYLETRYGGDLQSRTTSTSHAVFLRSSHGMDVLLRPETLSYRVLGGIIDLYFYLGDTAIQAIQQYVSSIGLPAMQQYWVLGFHQCRWGYKNVNDLRDVVKLYREANIPLEVIWSDLDYMYQYRDWTLDEKNFHPDEMHHFLEELHANNQYYVPIIDAGIYAGNPTNLSDVYDPYTAGLDKSIYALNPDSSLYIGNVWPGYTTFPDFYRNANTLKWWIEAMRNFSTLVDYDGFWLDMNEISTFCTGSCGNDKLSDNPSCLFDFVGSPSTDYPEGFNVTNSTEGFHADSAKAVMAQIMPAVAPDAPVQLDKIGRNVNYPPYKIKLAEELLNLASHTLSPNVTHHDGTLEYDIHNLYAYTETMTAYKSFLELRPNKRPFLLTRGTFPGSGSYAAHWGGDNSSKFYYMAFSIPQVLSFQIFGIPVVGVDTCGFGGNTDFELCARWMQLGAFLPFYRNHNEITSIPQEAYRWSSVAEASRIAINIRYSLLPYWYTLMYRAHVDGTPMVRALAWEFPNEEALKDADRQFLVGSAILVTPVLEPLVTTVNGVFPGSRNDIWYDWYNYTKIEVPNGKNVTMDAPLGHINLAVRGGSILPMQEPGYTTTETRKNSLKLLVALSSEGVAQGEIYLDDEALVPASTLNVEMTVADGSLSVRSRGKFVITTMLSKITILGVTSKPKRVHFDSPVVVNWAYDETSRILTIFDIDKFNGSDLKSFNWTLTWAESDTST
ncbi:putative family 31 glucosidase [Neolecta irregularis DAH-3]|uniref:alpha-glucosidase n=1 Tax=Neolecta irregularis (strain DAH-3) TaxID=1198029 RepID=A0A1U7LWD6_NEOID|nr:putative family 31 glucosidase [Neolecta irregularis DAH-3]|eukprot:OLL26883.1 putative family 31 glucosidase [Neolecta irregularis DAH-3]